MQRTLHIAQEIWALQVFGEQMKAYFPLLNQRVK